MEQKPLLDQTRELCRQLDIVPTRSKGQNFLVSDKVLEQIVEVAELGKTDTVLEIGPGLGILTEKLIEKAGRVVAVELDRKLFGYLMGKFKGTKNLELVEGDIIKLFHGSIASLLKEVGYKVVANLPYQITSHILRILLESEQSPSEMVVMVQKEVGERICAKRGEMSVLAVMVQYYSQPEIVAVVGRENFWPVPEVDSVVLRIKTLKQENIKTRKQENKKTRKQENRKTRNEESKKTGKQENGKSRKQEEEFFKLVKVGFSGKRKMLKNNLRNVYEEKVILEILDKLGLNPKVRAEDLGVEEWMKLYQNLKIKMQNDK